MNKQEQKIILDRIQIIENAIARYKALVKSENDSHWLAIYKQQLKESERDLNLFDSLLDDLGYSTGFNPVSGTMYMEKIIKEDNKMHTVLNPNSIPTDYQNNIELDTYPPVFSDYEKQIENPDYDSTFRVFSVPVSWFENYVVNNFGMTVNQFMQEYTWDDTFQIYESATKEKAVVKTCIIDR